MIIMYTGKPGGGKTYKAVDDILKLETQKKYVIIHNIDGLKKGKFKNPDEIISN